MNPEYIVRMARKAELICQSTPTAFWMEYHDLTPYLERFAALVAAAEREKVARFIIEQCFSTGRSDSIEGMLDALVRQVAEREREACAKVAEGGSFLHDDSPEARFGKACAKAIRASGEKP